MTSRRGTGSGYNHPTECSRENPLFCSLCRVNLKITIYCSRYFRRIKLLVPSGGLKRQKHTRDHWYPLLLVRNPRIESSAGKVTGFQYRLLNGACKVIVAVVAYGSG